MDRREKRAQSLLWEIQALRAAGDVEGAAKKSRTMAHLHEALANDLLDAANDRGWVHLQAAVTAWVKAGDAESYQRAVAVIANGIERCAEGWHNPTLLGMLWDLFGWVLQHPFPEAPSGDSRPPRLSPDEESRVRDVLLMLAGSPIASEHFSIAFSQLVSPRIATSA